jgi:large subunit ribosomal protein L22
MKVSTKLNNLRISPRKVRLVCNAIKGKDTGEALIDLGNLVRGSSLAIEKLIKSAIANAENNFGLDRENLYIFDAQVGEGPKYKRWMPRAYGRATPILKRTSNLTIILEERVEGKNRKTKEQMEKEKKAREEEKKKMEKELEKEQQEQKKEAPVPEVKAEKEKERKKESKGGWMRRFFRRKSG